MALATLGNPDAMQHPAAEAALLAAAEALPRCLLLGDGTDTVLELAGRDKGRTQQEERWGFAKEKREN